MKEVRVAQRYAKSLISLALERDVLEQVKDDMQTIKSVCEESRDFSNMLKSPIVKPDKKKTILNEIFSKEVSELSMMFINIVTEKKRESMLGAIAESFIMLYNDSKNIVTASVTTAAAITDDIRTQVMAQLNHSSSTRLFTRKTSRFSRALKGYMLVKESQRTTM